VLVIVMLAFGGIGSLLGPVVGAATFTVLEEWMDSFDEYRLIIYGSVILVLFLVLPRGVVPTVQRLVDVARRRAVRRAAAPTAQPPVDTLTHG
jgi:branched-chain amino acid transport system permease protein